MSERDEQPPPSQDPFAAAYRDYLAATKRAWAEVDIDALVDNASRSGQFGQAQAQAGACHTLGTLGTGGTVYTAPTLGSLLCVATTYSYGCVFETPEGTDPIVK